MALACPNCASPMNPEVLHGIGFNDCPVCGAIWIYADQLRHLFEGQMEALKEIEVLNMPKVAQTHCVSSHFLCPIDQVLLDRYHYLYDSPIVLDTCSKCGGIFVEAGEIAQMEKWREVAHQSVGPKEAVGIALADAEIKHQQEMARLRHMGFLFKVLNRYQPGWYGLFP